MGLARGAVALLLDEARKRPFHGRVATLGKQTIYTTASEIAGQFAKFKVEINGSIDPKATAVSDDELFKWLGLDDVTSLDYSDFEGASRIVDLNKETIPQDLVGIFDVVLDSGTLEHVFHLPNALKNTLSLLRVGGRMIFLSPSSNHVDHGFYMFSPTLFADYFAANGFRIETIYMVRYSGNLDELWEAYEYEPGQWRDMHIGGCDDHPYAIWAIAARTKDSTLDVIPQQGYYADNNPAYAGSHLATGDIAKGGTAQIAAAKSSAGAQGTPISCAPPASSLVTLARRILRRVPGARPLWHLVLLLRQRIRSMRQINPKAAVLPYAIFRKKFVGKF